MKTSVGVLLAIAIAGWLLYTQVWGTRDTRPIAWTDLTPKLGTIEFTRRVTGVYHSRAAFLRLLDATMPGRVPKLPPHNWDRDQGLVTALGPRPSTGYSHQIQRAGERNRGPYVYAR